MIYFGGVTLGYFNLYPVGFQRKNEKAREKSGARQGGRFSALLRRAWLALPAPRATVKNHR